MLKKRIKSILRCIYTLCTIILESKYMRLQVLSNPTVIALLKIILLLLKSQSNNEELRDMIIPVISP
jgi:hypothetical protein